MGDITAQFNTLRVNQQPLLHSNIYVESASGQLNEQALRNIFSAFGTIVSLRVAPERDGRKPHAFVKLEDTEQAWKAVNALTQNPPISGMVVRSAESDTGGTTGQGTPSDNLYLKNLPPNTTEHDVRLLCSQWGGGVLDCRSNAGDVSQLRPSMEYVNDCPMVLTKGGETLQRGLSALCRMRNVAEAQDVLQRLTNNENALTVVDTANLIVRFADTPKDKADKAAAKQQDIFMGRRPQPQIHRPFPPPDPDNLAFGPNFPFDSYNAGLTRIDGGIYPDAGLPYLSDPTMLQHGDNALDFDGLVPHQGAAGRSVLPNMWPGNMAGGPSQAGGPHAFDAARGESRSLYISNLPEDADDLTLYRLFALYGAVESVKTMVDQQTGKCRGIGFVNFLNPKKAKQVVEVSKKQYFIAGNRQLGVALQEADHHRPRRAPRNAQHM